MPHTKGLDSTHLSTSCAHDSHANFKGEWHSALYLVILLFLNLASKQPAAALWPGHLHDHRGCKKGILYPLSGNSRKHGRTFLVLPSRAPVEELRFMCYFGPRSAYVCLLVSAFCAGLRMSECMYTLHISLHNCVWLLCGLLCVLLHVLALL